MSEQVRQENKMGVMPIPKLLITMSLPMIASMLVQALYNIVDSQIYYQRICIRIMYNNQWIDMKKYKYSNELLAEIGKILGGLIKSLGVVTNA